MSLGVADPDRIGVTGHSHGALMTANLVAHSDLFRAGVATSGSYNKTLTPFGFQNERRSVWEAQDVYLKVSPFFFADKIKIPLLIMHGAEDANPGTTPAAGESSSSKPSAATAALLASSCFRTSHIGIPPWSRTSSWSTRCCAGLINT